MRNTSSLFPPLGRVRIQKGTIAEAIRLIGERTSLQVRPQSCLFGGVVGSEIGGLQFVLMHATGIKPSRGLLIALSHDSNAILVPSHRGNDLEEVGRSLCLRQAGEYMALFEYVSMEYGFLVRHEPAIPITLESDFVRLGITREEAPPLGERTYWWQKWGGKLYSVCHSVVGSDIHFSCRTVASRVGDWVPLPYALTR